MMNHTATQNTANTGGHSFGTFNGVFLPSILTMLGAIMFLRVNYVTGSGGITGTLLILVAGVLIVFATALSISAISTNTPVKNGGVYFLISRTLGPGFGGSIGVTLFLAQGISIPFNILGFVEAICIDYPTLQPYYFWISMGTGLLLLLITFSGADFAMKFQFFIFLALLQGIITMYAGAVFHFSPGTFQANLHSAENVSYGRLFALFFPALTGIMAGVNMSGDLKNPAKSIPKGILYTILVGFVLYALEIVLCGGAFVRNDLIQNPYQVMVDAAPFHLGFLLTLGVAAATLSTALGLFICAPRVLQALADDHIVPGLGIFGKGRGPHREPVYATVLLGILVMGIIAAASWRGLSLSGMNSGMNYVAEVASMCFLLTYTMVNLAAFVESYGRNPSFRPRFKFFHWTIALYGFLACLTVSFYIDFISAGIALFLAWILFVTIKKRKFEVAFGDARRGFLYSRIRENLLALARLPYDSKNWRPTISILSGKPEEQLYMPYFASILEADRGIVSMIKFTEYKEEAGKEWMSDRQKELNNLHDLLWTKNGFFNVFPETVYCADYDRALQVFLQSHLIGPLKPNIVMMNYPENPERMIQNLKHLHTIQSLNMSTLMMMNFAGFSMPDRMIRGTVDVWWRGTPNLAIMLILANILSSDPLWLGTRLRILRVVQPNENIRDMEQEMRDLLESSRIEAEVEMIRTAEDFRTVIRSKSADSAALFLGFLLQNDDEQNCRAFERLSSYLAGMPPAFIVCGAGGGADLNA